ncbi:cation diffusion facilitator family transporter [Vibrio sp. SS-MA-C1-2]|uniref:cation diffusion facilitator family transporter n=1 Tax=Vibrio sp. SS-MA-C1-2 TaxID=2908646 RepID=UPI001F4339B0|nr:cation diffusion facilitator family transporter [Vibrio sp. SS-MA-C1-2]UJF16911.1 cation diffusion facilitator family transporter [Vibrio sp. SS-MA-C1-2]
MPHHHHHNVENYNRLFALGIGLNVIYVLVEGIYGFSVDSLALIADAGHNLSDVFSLLLAWGAYALVKKAVTTRKTFGLKKVTVLASLTSALFLISSLAIIAYEAIYRFGNPVSTSGTVIMIVAAIGIVINGLTAMLFAHDKNHDLNIKGVFIHMAGDALVSLGVIISGLLINITHWHWLDSVTSLILVVMVLMATWPLFKASFNFACDGVPENIDTMEIANKLVSIPGVNQLHNFHIWPVSTTENAMISHVVTDIETDDYPELLAKIEKVLQEDYNIIQSTIQFESPTTAKECEALEHQLGLTIDKIS